MEDSPSEPEPEIQAEKAVLPVAIDENTLNILKNRQKEYKVAALMWKKAGNQEEAITCIKIAKHFEAVIAATSRGEAIDLSSMPPTPKMPTVTVSAETHSEEIKEENENQNSTDVQPNVPSM